MNQIKVYAGYNIDQDIRMSSSSGALFSLLAEYVLSIQGIVYGVKMSEDCYFAEFKRVTNCEELICLRGSKYLQAKVGNTYNQVKKDLASGKFVLFSGTGCQINGLRKFLKDEYENLICVDVICHGVPSPALWEKYVQYQEQKNGGKLKEINFRCKDDGWMDYGIKEIFECSFQYEKKEKYIKKDEDPYMQMFLQDYCLRPSCYECSAKKVKMSDITIADFWGIDNIAPELNDKRGTSLIIIRTRKGEEIFKEVRKKLKLKEVTYEEGVQCNPSEYKSCTRPTQRNTFFEDMKVCDFEGLQKKYIVLKRNSLVGKVKRKAKCIVKRVLKAIIYKRKVH